MTSYKEFAYIYDRLMNEDIDYDKWCDYIENLFTIHDIEPDSIFETACGTGNITSRLEKRGYDITASDISADMLSAASAKLKRTELLCCDMSKLQLSEKYDAFLCMIDGINYIIQPQLLERTFKNIHRSLNSNGAFIFDVSTRYKLKNILGNETYIHSDYDIFYSWQNRYIEKYCISDMLLNFFVRKGGSYRRFEERHIQRGWSEKQLRKMLSNAGFGEICVYKELTFSRPEKDCQRMVFVCRQQGL